MSQYESVKNKSNFLGIKIINKISSKINNSKITDENAFY